VRVVLFYLNTLGVTLLGTLTILRLGVGLSATVSGKGIWDKEFIPDRSVNVCAGLTEIFENEVGLSL
jgi:hypothetical protein